MCSDESQDISLFKANPEEATKGGWRPKASLPLCVEAVEGRPIRAIFARSAAGQPLFSHDFLPTRRLPACRRLACQPPACHPCVASLSAARLLPTCPLPPRRPLATGPSAISCSSSTGSACLAQAVQSSLYHSMRLPARLPAAGRLPPARRPPVCPPPVWR